MYSRGLWLLLLLLCNPFFSHAARKGKKTVRCKLIKHHGVILDAPKERSIKGRVTRIINLKKPCKKIVNKLEEELKQAGLFAVVVHREEREIHIVPKNYCKQNMSHLLLDPKSKQLKDFSSDGTSLWLAVNSSDLHLSDEEGQLSSAEEEEELYCGNESQQSEEENFEEEEVYNNEESDSEEDGYDDGYRPPDLSITRSGPITTTTSTTPSVNNRDDTKEPVDYSQFTVAVFKKGVHWPPCQEKKPAKFAWSLPAWFYRGN